jgi:hypothetical protein
VVTSLGLSEIEAEVFSWTLGLFQKAHSNSNTFVPKSSSSLVSPRSLLLRDIPS